MKRFLFRLERVLKLKQQRERLAELRQQQARQLVEAARAEVSRLTEQLRQTAGALHGKAAGPVAADTWIAHYVHSARLGQALESAEVHVQRALQRLQEAAAQRTKIAQEVEALQHLRDQQWEEHRQDMLRSEQIRLDELGMRRWTGGQVATGRGDLPREKGEVP